MFGLIISVINERLGTPTYNIAILGPQKTGKTLFFNNIKYIDQKNSYKQNSYKATVGLNVCHYKNKRDQFKVWDLGGKPGLRKIWDNYYSQCHGLIFTIDNRINQNIQLLIQVLSHQQMAKIPLVLLIVEPGLKNDIQNLFKGYGSLSCLQNRKYVIQQLFLQHISNSKSTIRQILHWLYSSIESLHNTLKD